MTRAIDFAEVFRGRRVFLTGHTGFKGSWLALWLHRLGAEVTGFALAPDTEPSLFRLLGLADKIRHVEGDIRDLKALARAVGDSRPEVVIHMAAQALVRPSYRDPKTTFDTNVGGTVNLFEAVRTTGGVRALVNVTSDKCYENREWVWGYRENDPMGGHDPYSASKGCAELVASAYTNSYFSPERFADHGLAVASARAGNVIGGGDWSVDRIVPDCVRAWSQGGSVPVRSPGAIRPWQYVLEPLAGYLTLAASLLAEPVRTAGGWNFGPLPDNCRTVGEVVAALSSTWGGAAWEDTSDKQVAKLHEANFLRLCIDKAVSGLGWRPVWGFDETVAQTVRWYREFYRERADAVPLCLDQIEQYESGRRQVAAPPA